MSGALDRLAEEQAIRTLLARRATSSDRRDPAAMLALHTEGGTDDHGAGREPARDFIQRLARTSYRDPDNGPQQHHLGNVLVHWVGADTARVESYHLAYHRFGVLSGPTDHHVGGRYLDLVRRTGGRWRIADRTVVYDWSRSVPATRPVPPSGTRHLDPGEPPAMTDTLEPDRLAALLAKQDITEVLYRRARAGDRRDHALALSCYHEGATEEHEGFTGPAAEFLLERSAYAPGKTPPTDSLVHMVTNVLIDLDGDEAAVEAYHLCLMSGGGTDTVIGGRYLDRFAFRDGRWAITHRQVVFDWSRVEPAAPRFWDRYPDQSRIAFGRMGPDDPVYAFTAATSSRGDD